MGEYTVSPSTFGSWYVYIRDRGGWLRRDNNKVTQNTKGSAKEDWVGYFPTRAFAENAYRRYINKTPIYLGGE